MWQPLVSILVRNFNEGHSLKRMLKMLEKQKYKHWELLACDSGSTDGSAEELANSFAKVFIKIPKDAYKPGVVLNRLARHARGQVLVFNNADCIPVGENWLWELINPLQPIHSSILQKEIIVPLTTFSCQIGHSNLRTSLQRDLEHAYGNGIEQKKWFHFFSMASCATLRETILNNPLSENLDYCEDIEWSYRLLKKAKEPSKKKLIYYADKSVVLHDHNYSYWYLACRKFGEGRSLAHIFPQIYGIVFIFIRTPLSFLKQVADDFFFIQKDERLKKVLDILMYRIVAQLSFSVGVVSRFFKRIKIL